VDFTCRQYVYLTALRETGVWKEETQIGSTRIKGVVGYISGTYRKEDEEMGSGRSNSFGRPLVIPTYKDINTMMCIERFREWEGHKFQCCRE